MLLPPHYADVVRIRGIGRSQTLDVIAAEFGVCKSNVSAILNRHTWKHVA